MRAIEITSPGGPEVLRVSEVPAPAPGPGQILVEVRAVGVNRADLLQRQGHYPAPPGAPDRIPGLEYAGVVVGAGPGASRWRVGDRVMGITAGGAYAEALVTDEREALPVPTDLSFTEAAAIPEAFITAHDALFTILGLRPGESLLVHAVGSGVGLAALQLAGASDARVIGTSRSAWKLERSRDLGLDVAIQTGGRDPVLGRILERGMPLDTYDQGWAPGEGETIEFDQAVRQAAGGAGVDLILDLVGGAYLPGNLRALAQRGRMAVVGLVAGRRAELDLGLLLSRRISLTGTVLRSRPLEEKVAVAESFRAEVLPLFNEGELRPVIDSVYPFVEAGAAHSRVESNLNFGKVVLSWES